MDVVIIAAIISIAALLLGYLLNRLVRTLDRVEEKVNSVITKVDVMDEDLTNVHTNCTIKHEAIEKWKENKSNLIHDLELKVVKITP